MKFGLGVTNVEKVYLDATISIVDGKTVIITPFGTFNQYSDGGTDDNGNPKYKVRNPADGYYYYYNFEGILIEVDNNYIN